MSTSNMYDLPGPVARRRIRIWSWIGSIAALGILAFLVARFASYGQLDSAKWAIFSNSQVIALLGRGLTSTLSAFGIAVVCALTVGVILALGRVIGPRWLSIVLRWYTEIARSLPSLLVLYFLLLVLPKAGIRIPTLWQLVIALTVTNSALISEIIRSAIQSVPKGQVEAAYSLGLTRLATMRLVILPQALRACLPSLLAQTIYLMKGTTLGYVVSYEELLYTSRTIGEYTGNILQAIMVAGLFYTIVNFLISRLVVFLNRRSAPGASSTTMKLMPEISARSTT